MQKGKQALLLHLGVCLCLCSTILLPCRNLLLLTTLLRTLSSLNLFFFPSLPLPVHLFPIFAFPIFHPTWRTSISSSCSSFFFFFHSSNPYLHIPLLILHDFLPFSLLLVMLHCSCGNFGIMPVVLWPWPGGQFLGAEGRWSSCLREPAVLDNVPDWKDEQLEGWRPVGAGRGHRGHSHSKLWLPAQRYGVKEDHASGGEKELLFLRGSQRTQPCSRPSRPSRTTTSSFSCRVIAFSVLLCNSNRKYYICPAAQR